MPKDNVAGQGQTKTIFSQILHYSPQNHVTRHKCLSMMCRVSDPCSYVQGRGQRLGLN